jgi:hypothetical protein
MDGTQLMALPQKAQVLLTEEVQKSPSNFNRTRPTSMTHYMTVDCTAVCANWSRDGLCTSREKGRGTVILGVSLVHHGGCPTNIRDSIHSHSYLLFKIQ